ncbi:MAG TPA: general secretion pathway protein GspB [Gammaproteobacteria bacterium]
MSMILDALRKSDRQRTRAAADRLREGPAAAQAREFDGRLLAVLAGALLFAVAGVLIALWPLPRADRTATGQAAEIMENGPPEIRAPVRDLSGELPRRPAVAAPVKAEPAPSRAEIVENLAAPPLEALPAAIRIRLPKLQVNIHAWSENPEERFVLINLRRYQEGDRLEEGPMLRRILRNGVVLEFEGTLFTLPRR